MALDSLLCALFPPVQVVSVCSPKRAHYTPANPVSLPLGVKGHACDQELGPCSTQVWPKEREKTIYPWTIAIYVFSALRHWGGAWWREGGTHHSSSKNAE